MLIMPAFFGHDINITIQAQYRYWIGPTLILFFGQFMAKL